MSDVAAKSMTQIQRDAWMALCEEFNLDWELVDLEKAVGLRWAAPVLKISSAKNPAGILIFPPGTKIMKFADRLTSAGFGFSVVAAPATDSAQEIIEGGQILADWGLI